MPTETPKDVEDVDLDRVDGERMWYRVDYKGNVVFRFATLAMIMEVANAKNPKSPLSGAKVRSASNKDRHELDPHPSPYGNWWIYSYREDV